MTWRGDAPRYGDDERRDIPHVSNRMNELLGLVHVPLPEHKAAVHLLLTSLDGGTWAAMGAEGVRIPDEDLSKDTVPFPPMKWTDHDRWGWFDRDGVLHFAVDMSHGVSVLDRDSTRLFGVATAKDGTQALVVWRISPVRNAAHVGQ